MLTNQKVTNQKLLSLLLLFLISPSLQSRCCSCWLSISICRMEQFLQISNYMRCRNKACQRINGKIVANVVVNFALNLCCNQETIAQCLNSTAHFLSTFHHQDYFLQKLVYQFAGILQVHAENYPEEQSNSFRKVFNIFHYHCLLDNDGATWWMPVTDDCDEGWHILIRNWLFLFYLNES